MKKYHYECLKNFDGHSDDQMYALNKLGERGYKIVTTTDRGSSFDDIILMKEYDDETK